ncbi:MAG: hypothetical protein ACKOIA_07050 [Acidimicrobiia bacterium]
MNGRSFLAEADSRGRLSLGSVLTAQRYLVSTDDEGRILLEPAVVMTATEERLLADAGFRAEATRAAREPASPLDLDDL